MPTTDGEQAGGVARRVGSREIEIQTPVPAVSPVATQTAVVKSASVATRCAPSVADTSMQTEELALPARCCEASTQTLAETVTVQSTATQC